MDAAPPGPPGLDLGRLSRYLAEHAPGLIAEPLDATVIAGGRSNLTYRVTGGDGSIVLRRPPLGHVLPTAHDMAREYRVIAALNPTGFPVPDALHLCTDPEVIGAPFYLMSHVDGLVLRGEEIFALSSQTAARTGELLIHTLAQLHSIDPAEVGLGDFGRPDGYLERQVRRWYEQWGRSKTRELATLDEVAATLAKTVPTPTRAGIVHGDYRLDNVMVDHEVRRILAVLDWEMCTLGDPLADLGLMIVYTRLAEFGSAPTTPRFGPEQGFLSAPELIERYARAAPESGGVDQIGWYVALGYYKLAIISEGIHARFLMGKTVGEGFSVMGERVPDLIDRSIAALDGNV